MNYLAHTLILPPAGIWAAVSPTGPGLPPYRGVEISGTDLSTSSVWLASGALASGLACGHHPASQGKI